MLSGLDALDKQMLTAQTKGWAASADQCLAREQVWNKLVREIKEAIYGRRWDRLQLLLSIGSILAIAIPYVGPHVSMCLWFRSGCIGTRVSLPASPLGQTDIRRVPDRRIGNPARPFLLDEHGPEGGVGPLAALRGPLAAGRVRGCQCLPGECRATPAASA